MNRRLPFRIEPFPVILSAAWVAGVFAISPAPLQDLWRPLILSVALAATWMALASFIGRGRRWVPVAAGTAWLVATTSWFLGAIVGLLIASRIVIGWARRRAGKSDLREPAPAWVGRMASTLGVFLLIAAIFGAVNGGVLSPAGGARPIELNSGGPSIYLVLLDGYPRGDTVEAEFGFSNEPFLAALEARGFDVARNARSNYNTTTLTIASMLHMAYVHDIPSLAGDPGNPISQVRRLTAAINDAPVMETLRSGGYSIETVPSWYGEATVHSADEVHGSGTISIFEEQVLRLSTLGSIALDLHPDLVAQQQRDRFAFTLETVSRRGKNGDGPKLVFAHSFSPHSPILYRADGGPYPPPACYPSRCSFNITDASALAPSDAAFADAFEAQLSYLNEQLLTMVDSLIDSDPSAVIVLFSDHGARHEPGDADEPFRILFAARTPEAPRIFSDEASPMDIFPTILNAYSGTATDVPDYQAWSADPGAPLELTPVR